MILNAAAPALDPTIARRIRLVCFDVDGVLTDGGIILGDAGGEPIELKQYDIQDGLGVVMLRQMGILTAIITGRESRSVAMRARELEVDDLVQDAKGRKVPALRLLLERRGIAADEVAFVGDDLPDLGVMRMVGLPVCVANASPEARRESRLELTRAGGRGAVREFCEVLLRARGEWERAVEAYVASRGEVA